jgi:hypothetical protein
MSNTIALLPTLPPESAQVEIPASMNPEEKAQLVAELGKISTEIARVQTRDEERNRFAEQRWRAVDARLAKLEGHADASGQHDLAVVTKALDKATTNNEKIKWWALSILTTLATSAVVGLVVHYLASR